MNLYELAVCVSCALLVTSRGGAASADHRICRFTEDQTWTTSSNDYSVSGKCFEFQRLKIHRDQSTTNLVVVENEGQHFPVLKFSDFARDFVAPHLFVESIEKLLTC